MPPDLGRGVSVYVLDTGLDVDHPALAGRVGALPVGHAGDFVNDDWGEEHGARDCHGHGTHLAGIVAGPQGVASGAEVSGLRVARCDGSGDSETAVAALRWLVDGARRPAVVLMSLQYENAPAVNAAVRALVDTGITVVVAAGESMRDACEFMPSGASGALVVGGTDQNDVARKHSNWGSCIGIWAPGDRIASLALGRGESEIKSGSSMAAAFVAGAAAVYLERHPAARPAEVRAALLDAATEGTVTISRRRFAEVTTRRLLSIPPDWY